MWAFQHSWAALGETLSIMSKDFLDTMAEYGCLFLLLAFSILGARPELKFSNSHIIFGREHATNHLTWWLKYIFFVENQLPFSILQKLMSYLRFFRELKARRNQWNNPPLDYQLSKRTIEKILVFETDPLPSINQAQYE